MINFYPLTTAEQASFTALTEAKTNNAPMLILTEPSDTSGAGVDAGALQAPEYSDYMGTITFDSGKIVILDPEEIEAIRQAKSHFPSYPIEPDRSISSCMRRLFSSSNRLVKNRSFLA